MNSGGFKTVSLPCANIFRILLIQLISPEIRPCSLPASSNSCSIGGGRGLPFRSTRPSNCVPSRSLKANSKQGQGLACSKRQQIIRKTGIDIGIPHRIMAAPDALRHIVPRFNYRNALAEAPRRYPRPSQHARLSPKNDCGIRPFARPKVRLSGDRASRSSPATGDVEPLRVKA